jgi:CSLREA domain-containing protein
MDRNTIAKRLTGPVLLALGAIALISFGDAPARAGGNTFTVNSDLDPGDGVCDGTCTLRDAIIFANASPGHDSIVFNPNTVPDAIYVIELSSLLPSIDGSQGITVDGSGLFGKAVITGQALAEDGSGLLVRGSPGVGPSDIHLRRLGLTDFSHNGLDICAGLLPETCDYDLSNVEIADVFADNNGRTGISVRAADVDSVGVTVSDAFDNGYHGMSFDATGDLLDVTVDDVRVSGSGLESILVANNSADGDLQNVSITNSSFSGAPVIVGSEGPVQDIVLDGNESLADGGFNVYSNGGDLTSVEITNNAVSGADIDGISVSNSGTPQVGVMSGVRIEDNTITGSNRTGIRFQGVSGPEPNVIEGNTLSGNGWDGVTIYDSEGGLGGARVKISRNATYSNGQLGIDLYKPGEAAPGVTANDIGDSDQGPNGLLNSPEFSAPTGYSHANGSACPNCLVEVFVSDNDASGYGEGQQFLFDLTAGSSGDFVVPLCGLGLVGGAHITATATDPPGNTSEFSENYTLLQDSEPCPTATPSPSPSPSPTPSPTPGATGTPSSSPTGTATSTPPPGQKIWGNSDCSQDGIRSRDGQATGKFVLQGTALTQTEPCPDVGATVTVDGLQRTWGNWDCSADGIRSRDGQSTGKFVLHGNALIQTEPCPDIGTQVTVQ